MPRRRRQDDIRISVAGDLDGMTVGALRAMLDGISDDTRIEIDEEDSADYGSGTVDTYYHLVIRKD